MLEFELATEISATTDSVWHALSSLSEWATWNRLVPRASGQLVGGSTLHFEVRDVNGELVQLDPLVVSVVPPRELTLEAYVGSRRLLRLTHTFSIESTDRSESVLRQRWVLAEPLDQSAWTVVCDRLARWTALGDDLAGYLGKKGRPPSHVAPGRKG